MDAKTVEHDQVSDGGQHPQPRIRSWTWTLLIVGVALVAAVGAVLVFAQLDEGRPVPDFPALADKPDRSLKGTVAYYSPGGCVRIVAAAGAPSKDVYCLPKEDMTKTPQVGKEVGPQLVWLPDGRLEVTMFRMDFSAAKDKKSAPPLVGAWQKIVNVRTGEVVDVPAEDVPAKMNLTSRRTVDPQGRKLTTTSHSGSGKVKVVLTDDSGSRTLMSAHGPGKYMYGLQPAFWAPNWQWVAADDGRILVITTGENPTTRVLVEERGGRSGGAEGATFAVSGEDYLTP